MKFFNMKKENSKQRLFEIMSKLDKTFKLTLNETYIDKVNIAKNIMTNVSGDEITTPYNEINKWMDERRNSWVSINFNLESNVFYIQKRFENENLDDEYGVDIQIPINYENPTETETKLSELFNYLTSKRIIDVSHLKNNSGLDETI